MATVKPWQIQQAADALRIYRYQYRGAPEGGDACDTVQSSPDDADALDRLREIMRLRHYAKSTEKTYLHWTRRFLAYRRRVDCDGGPTPVHGSRAGGGH